MTRPAFDPDGNFLTLVSSEYEAAAIRRGEAVVTDDGYLVVVPQPIKELTPEEKRRIALAKERQRK
jgi:hypothetical protein